MKALARYARRCFTRPVGGLLQEDVEAGARQLFGGLARLSDPWGGFVTRATGSRVDLSKDVRRFVVCTGPPTGDRQPDRQRRAELRLDSQKGAAKQGIVALTDTRTIQVVRRGGRVAKKASG